MKGILLLFFIMLDWDIFALNYFDNIYFFKTVEWNIGFLLFIFLMYFYQSTQKEKTSTEVIIFFTFYVVNFVTLISVLYYFHLSKVIIEPIKVINITPITQEVAKGYIKTENSKIKVDFNRENYELFLKEINQIKFCKSSKLIKFYKGGIIKNHNNYRLYCVLPKVEVQF